jgi:hypothetical protein
VAVGVVHRLEPVQVQDDEGKGPAVAGHAEELPLKDEFQIASVPQAGEEVGVGVQPGLQVAILEAHQQREEAHVGQVGPQELGQGVQVDGGVVVAKAP